ncbi:ABC transporter ATP-binding protein [Haloferax mediterranei ATCC 33500]|uniref:ABC transporter ATP-binding protein n=1 Tax=Haloferax mediterranei (strain ATCC 33500 / DSM 1411 / JCM 8866 / NBRC 14739 / NCIMB 2177 / R-4) TaxID=523841 RepID=I3R6Q1_HALMT|nr:ABC transporter ATP-binding protein [Haloferax mediterranei]AFK19911.1 ABC transporter ATP-binding protein LolDE [Haloferax mediterranei ATCC 33500]AHZ23290.1 ABC transporter ATP-binding protein [Haloferax mediterranei ATCC 33500]ELZ99455.1 ABC transporter ATP-binding protein [Haloferax mediterranei ATCC 33500]MDX5987340.1 ABC transporter ATP-binding protein [Haloferax mediterranei ATCC 33500]QCQ73855.1 ABC transporter ATP-binding protein [Haloferax mediterranei ATCC 33500]
MADSVSEHRPRSVDDAATALHCERVVREYSRGPDSLFSRGSDAPTVRALDGVSLSISTGEFVAIAGPSGSGKSTLLHLLAALDTPTQGDVTVAETDVRSLSARGRTKLRRDTIGIVFQHFHLLPSLSARGNVALPLIERGVSKRGRRKRADELLEQVGLADRAGHKPGELSGGEQQRVAIARALVSDPAVLIADEPTGELDTETGQRVLDYIEQTASDRAVVVATHDDHVIDRADRVVRLRDGVVVSDE